MAVAHSFGAYKKTPYPAGRIPVVGFHPAMNDVFKVYAI
jgi:hypothetical protein